MTLPTPRFGRRRAIRASLAAILGTVSATGIWSALTPSPLLAKPDAPGGVVRIGYQKSGTVLVSLKAKGILEKALQGRGTKVQWSEFTAGLPMVEALNAGAIDLGYVGEAPPIFAQAATGSVTRYVAYDPYGQRAEGILVHRDSKIRSLADLKGKKIAVQKGSNTHYLVVKALQAAKLKPSQVEIVFLKPSDGRAAFERKDVSAWAVWDPYLADAEANAEARLLTDAKGLAPNRGYYLSSSNFISERPGTLKLVLKAIYKEGQSVSANPEGTANFLAPILGLQANVLATAEKRRKHGALPITDPKIIEQQQDIADTFSELQLIPKKINVKDAIWKWN